VYLDLFTGAHSPVRKAHINTGKGLLNWNFTHSKLTDGTKVPLRVGEDSLSLQPHFEALLDLENQKSKELSYLGAIA
jgi:hypothetical protein